jgi:hypothetical protein
MYDVPHVLEVTCLCYCWIRVYMQCSISSSTVWCVLCAACLQAIAPDLTENGCCVSCLRSQVDDFIEALYKLARPVRFTNGWR